MSTPERQKIVYMSRKEKGICVKCGKVEAMPNKTVCTDCSKKTTLNTKETRKFLTSLGLCINCRIRQAEPNKKMCYECLGAEQDKYYEKRVNGEYVQKQKADTERKRRLAEERRSQGICYRCGKRKAEGLCGMCKAKAKQYRDKKKLTLDRSEWTSYNLCYLCGKNPLYQHYKVCESCYQVRLSTVPKMIEGMNMETNYFKKLNDRFYANRNKMKGN